MKQKPIRPLSVGDKCIVISAENLKNVGKTVVIVARLHRCESCAASIADKNFTLFDCEGDDIVPNSGDHPCDFGVKTTFRSAGAWLRRIDEEDKELPFFECAPIEEKT